MEFGKWKVLKNGDMDFDNGRYFIDGNRLGHEDWILHLMEKDWVNMNDFIPAYFQALQNIGIKYLKIQSFY
jgi:hypothetical protein